MFMDVGAQTDTPTLSSHLNGFCSQKELLHAGLALVEQIELTEGKVTLLPSYPSQVVFPSGGRERKQHCFQPPFAWLEAGLWIF